MIKIAVLDDYQNAFQQIVEVKKYKDKFDFKVFNESFTDEKEAIFELEDFELEDLNSKILNWKICVKRQHLPWEMRCFCVATFFIALKTTILGA